MAFTRRRFLGAAAAVAVSSRFSLADTLTIDGFLEIRLQRATLGLLEHGTGHAEAWLFGAGPAPAVIRARQGEELKLRFINDLNHEIWLHFFGVRGPSELMTINVPPGADQAVDCVFTPPDAGSFWVGPMADQSRTRGLGLYALLAVDEAVAVPGLAEQVLILDDWKLDDSGAVVANFGDVETMVGEGRLGNWFTVNNRYRPQLALKPSQFTRLRLLNAANVRTMAVLFKGYDPLLIARDGQPLKPASLSGKPLELAPGQRADVLVSPEEGEIVIALDLFEEVSEIAYLVPAQKGAAPAAIADNFTLPPNPVATPGDAAAVRSVSLVLEGGLKGGLKVAKLNGEERDLRSLLENGKGWAINGVAGPAAEPLFTAKQGVTLGLEIDNRTAFAQPLHIHGHVWQDAGVEPAGGWQDTAVMAAGEKRTWMFVADNPGTWAVHSLVAERADGGMIGSFVVSDAGD